MRYSAFYCAQGDFMVYDDGEQGALFRLANELGPSILTVVLAHEFGHVIQARAGELDRGLPTIATEQQADCFAGAWVARAVRGEAEGVAFTDADVRIGLSGMIAVRDPIGTDQLDTGGHGSAFDRVGAFQVGFVEGPPVAPACSTTRCRSSTTASSIRRRSGQLAVRLRRRARSARSSSTTSTPTGRSVLTAAGATLPALEVVPVGEDRVVECSDPAATTGTGVVYCASTQQVFFDEATGDRPLRAVRRLRHRLPVRRGVERGRPAGAGQPARR